MLSPYRSTTGRNQPSTTKFIFGPAVWTRGLIKPPPGYGIAYVDWSQQEFGIAAALSGDELMKRAYMSGDPYLEFAKQGGVVPTDATRQSHAALREQCKACVIAVQYGMGAEALAARINQPVARARELLYLHKNTYRVFWRWSDAALDYAMLYGHMHTVFDWRLHLTRSANPRSVRNFPMQANGAEMLRLACSVLVERGIEVCAPVHDAVLVQYALEEREPIIQATQQIMTEASEVILDGFRLNSDVAYYDYPDRYSDPRGESIWCMVQNLIEEERYVA